MQTIVEFYQKSEKFVELFNTFAAKHSLEGELVPIIFAANAD